ncbi:MAG: hypothetical protein GX921_07490 [Bacteroidales bacterium]|nr:hypothetical protein [Bacteroidales bacterium]
MRIIFVKIAFVSMIVLAFIVLAPFLVKILTAGRYVDSTKYAVIVSLSTITSMLYHSLSQVTIALGFTKITLTNKIVGSLLSIAMFYLLISKMGAVGAAWGIVFSFLIFFVGNIILVTLRYRASKNNSDEANS